jgi:hypothetical protein
MIDCLGFSTLSCHSFFAGKGKAMLLFACLAIAASFLVGQALYVFCIFPFR